MSHLPHPRAVLFADGGLPPSIPVCDHYCGTEERMRKSLALQAALGPLFDVTFDALMPASAPARLMITGGVGYYNIDLGSGIAKQSKIGFGGGAAVAFKMGTSSTRFVVATRYTSVSTDGTSRLNFLPITVGLTFGK